MGRNLLAATVSLGALVAVQAAQASTIVHDTVGEFTIVNRQGPGVAADRSNIGSMFNNSVTVSPISFFSLGLGASASPLPALQPFASAPTASLDFFIDPFRGIVTGAISEATGAATGNPDRADIYLGFNGGSWTRIGTVHNGHGLAGSPVNGAVLTPSPIVSWTVLPRTGVTAPNFAYNFTFTVLSGNWNSLRIVDGRASTSGDGFDIAEFELTSVVIPEPGTLALLGAGLLGLVATRRRKPA